MEDLIKTFDEQRNIAITDSGDASIDFCIEHFIHSANKAIEKHGQFTVALSGGSTPKKIFQSLAQEKNKARIDWSKVKLFWSDERTVAPTDPDSNYYMAMENGFNKIAVLKENIFRMVGENDPEEGAIQYEKILSKELKNGSFDLVMLGMGDDGHTASLFPKTHGLHAKNRQVIANYIPQKETWRLSLTFDSINAANEIVVYILGKNKADMVKQTLLGKFDPDITPIQRVGTPSTKALWILDSDAANKLYV